MDNKYYSRATQEEVDLFNGLFWTEWNKIFKEKYQRRIPTEREVERERADLMDFMLPLKKRHLRKLLRKNLDKQIQVLFKSVVDMGGMDPYPAPIHVEHQLKNDNFIPSSKQEKLDNATKEEAKRF